MPIELLTESTTGERKMNQERLTTLTTAYKRNFDALAHSSFVIRHSSFVIRHSRMASTSVTPVCTPPWQAARSDARICASAVHQAGVPAWLRRPLEWQSRSS